MMKKILLSGIQPSGSLMIGNYIGALKNCLSMQDSYDCLFPLVDLHAMTVRQNPTELRERCLEFVCLYLACGLDPNKSTIFIQSHVPTHAQLAVLLNNYTQMGELQRMTQYKDKSGKHNANAGLFDYPVLMAADILVHRANLVPVGADQKQHLELARTIAKRFNNIYGDVFVIPEVYTPEVGARIMSLLDPSSKMSKSDTNPNSYVALLDPPETVRRKLSRAVTDPENIIRYDPAEKPGISNLIAMFSALTSRSIGSIEKQFETSGYAQLKADLAEVINDLLHPIQTRYHEIRQDEKFLTDILRRGSAAGRQRSKALLETVHDVIGLIPNCGTANPDLSVARP